MTKDEEILLNLLKSDEKWNNVFKFIIELSIKNPRREKIFRDQIVNLIEYVTDIDDDKEDSLRK
jgi:membrane-bound lytic murein transglycosylase B